jgi:hypothetical protein
MSCSSVFVLILSNIPFGPVTLGIYTTTGGEVSTLVSKTTVGGGGVVVTTAGTKHIASTTHVSVAADIEIARFNIDRTHFSSNIELM